MISLKRTVSFTNVEDLKDILYVCHYKGTTFSEFARNCMRSEVKRSLKRMKDDKHSEMHVRITEEELHKLIG